MGDEPFIIWCTPLHASCERHATFSLDVATIITGSPDSTCVRGQDRAFFAVTSTPATILVYSNLNVNGGDDNVTFDAQLLDGLTYERTLIGGVAVCGFYPKPILDNGGYVVGWIMNQQYKELFVPSWSLSTCLAMCGFGDKNQSYNTKILRSLHGKQLFLEPSKGTHTVCVLATYGNSNGVAIIWAISKDVAYGHKHIRNELFLKYGLLDPVLWQWHQPPKEFFRIMSLASNEVRLSISDQCFINTTNDSVDVIIDIGQHDCEHHDIAHRQRVIYELSTNKTTNYPVSVCLPYSGSYDRIIRVDSTTLKANKTMRMNYYGVTTNYIQW